MRGEEIVDILNEEGKIIGTISRGEAERDNHTTENVLVFIFNSLGKVWVQLRPDWKPHYPGRWDISACGGVVTGEKHDVTAQRETEEETKLIGLELRYIETFLNIFPGDEGEERRRLSHLYVGVTDELPRADGKEVMEFKLWEPSEVRVEAVTHPDLYIPSFVVELDKAVATHQQR